jgi:hypothetical protein
VLRLAPGAESPWREALTRAGLDSNPGKGRRTSSINFEDCLDAVRACVAANDGKRVSYREYRKWVTEQETWYPSGPSVRKAAATRGMGWNDVIDIIAPEPENTPTESGEGPR